jgi:hypothetical protein
LLRDETFTLFPTMCTRTSSVPRSHIFALAHVHHSKSSHPRYPYIWINSHDHRLWKVNNH